MLLAGTNDIAGNTGPESDEDIEQNIAAIAELSAANSARVVLAGILPISDYHQKPDQVPADDAASDVAHRRRQRLDEARTRPITGTCSWTTRRVSPTIAAC